MAGNQQELRYGAQVNALSLPKSLGISLRSVSCRLLAVSCKLSARNNGIQMSHRETGDHQDVVYGIHSVREAVGSRAVDFVMITQGYHNPRLQEIVDACRTAGISLRFSPRMAVERAAGTTQHQNVVAVCTPKAYDDISDLVATAERPLLIALDGVEDPSNLGAILRTVVAAGAG